MQDLRCNLAGCIYSIFGRCKADEVVLQEYEERGYLVCDTYDVTKEEVPEDDGDKCTGN